MIIIVIIIIIIVAGKNFKAGITNRQVFMFSEKTFPFWAALEIPSSIFIDLILLSTPLTIPFF